MHRIKSVVLSLVFMLMLSNVSFGASEDFMREIGKIYVVVSVIAVIFVGLVTYLIYLERKIKTLEKKLEDE